MNTKELNYVDVDMNVCRFFDGLFLNLDVCVVHLKKVMVFLSK